MSQSLTIEIYPKAYKDLEHFPLSIRKQILNDIGILEKIPWPGPPSAKKIGNNLYRLRSGSYRAIFERTKDLVTVLRIVDRKELERILQRLY